MADTFQEALDAVLADGWSIELSAPWETDDGLPYHVRLHRDDEFVFGNGRTAVDALQAAVADVDASRAFWVTFNALDPIDHRYRHHLLRAGYESAEQVARASDAELLTVRWVGPATVRDIRMALAGR